MCGKFVIELVVQENLKYMLYVCKDSLALFVFLIIFDARSCISAGNQNQLFNKCNVISCELMDRY